MTRRNAQLIGLGAIGVAICVQLFNDHYCYKMELTESIKSLWFPSIPLIPALIFLFTKNPLRAVTSSLVVIIFYFIAYYEDCIRPYEGGGASMIYVVVIFYGTPLAALFGFAADSICKVRNIKVEAR